MNESTDTKYHLMGNLPDENTVNFLQTSVRALFISGRFGSGKTTLINSLLKSNKYTFITKKTPRSPRKLEREGIVPFFGISMDLFLRQVQEGNDTYFACRNTIFDADDLTENDESIEFIKQFISIYSLTEIYKHSLEAKAQNKIIVFEITPEQEKDWVFFFPTACFVRLVVKKSVCTNRLLNRRKEDPEIDPSGKITALKIATSEKISQNEKDMRLDDWYKYKLYKLQNNNCLDFVANYIFVRWICEASPMFKKIASVLSSCKDAATTSTPGG